MGEPAARRRVACREGGLPARSSGGSRVWKEGFHAHVHSSNHAPF